MPSFEFKCPACGRREGVWIPSGSEIKHSCIKCGKKTERQWTAPAIKFKGAGFYSNDSKEKK